MTASSTPPDPPDVLRSDGEAVLFGFPAVPVAVTLRPRSRAWRLAGAARTVGISVLIAPAVAVIPPHAPWAIGALGVGGILARRRLSERFTVVRVEGPCPRCGAELEVRGGRLRAPHPLPCEACHHDSTLRLPDGMLERRAAEAG